jgi:hypothetical protein
MRSLQDNFSGAEIYGLSVAEPAHFLMYLLGYKESDSERVYGGHLYDAASVVWLLNRDGCPKYALRPAGPFAEAGYLELVRFLFEYHGIQPSQPVRDRSGLSIPIQGMERFLQSHGGPEHTVQSLEETSEKTFAKMDAKAREEAEKTIESIARTFGESLDRASHIAFAGRLGGTVELMSGETVPVIEPEMRGTSNWNTARLLTALAPKALSDPEARALATRLVSRLYQEMRNDGLSPEERAVNFAGTAVISLLGSLLADPLGLFANLAAGGQNTKSSGLASLAVDDIEVRPADCRRLDSDPYEVDVSFFDFNNQFRGRTVLSLTVDVADVVPRLDGQRIYTRR